MSKIEFNLISPIIPGETKIETILRNRGIADIEHFLNTSDDDILAPDTIDRMQDGAKMLIIHIKNEDNIYIQVDEDCDGYTSASCLINYLYKLFPAFCAKHLFYGIHNEKEHGIDIDTIGDKPNIKLVIVPDAGSNQFEEHRFLKEKGIDVLIIDHHLAEKISENACVINNQLCDYPTKSLSGVGMVYKFCSYIDSKLGLDYAKDYEDLVALGMIADMMDTRDYETRELIMRGIKNIKNPFFKTMIEKQSYQLSNGVTPAGIAFYIVPYINAVTRVGDLDERTLMLKGMLEHLAYTDILSTKRGCKGQTEKLVEQAVRVCSNIKNSKQTKSKNSGLELAQDYIKDNNLQDKKVIIVQIENNSIDHNLNGLIANQLMGQYQRPVMVVQKYEDDDGIYWAGSGRGYSKGELTDFRNFLLDSGLMRYAQGHDNAFGVAINDDKLDALKSYCELKLKDIDFSANYNVDFIFSTDLITNEDIYEIADYDYIWAQAVEEPFVVIKNISVTQDNLKFIGASKNTLRIQYGDISFIKFFIKDEEKNLLDPGVGHYIIDIVGTCHRNIFNGVCSPQIIIEDYEIRNRSAYYF